MKAPLLALLTTLCLHGQTGTHPFTLPNGLTLVLLESHEHPLVRARLYLPLEAVDKPAVCPDLPDQFLLLLDHAGRAGQKAGEGELELEERGIQVRGSVAAEGYCWQIVARSRDQDQALGFLGDLLFRPIFDPQTWPRPGGLSWEAALAFYHRVFRPDHAILVLHGDLGLEQAKQLVLLSLGTWSSRPEPPSATPVPGPNAEVRVLRQLLAGSGQALSRTFTQSDLDRARRAWASQQSLLSLDPGAQMALAMEEARGLAPRRDRMAALTLADLNR